MANGQGKRLSDFAGATGFTDGDLVYMTQAGVTVKGTIAQLRIALATSPTRETFFNGTDFTAGSSTSITLAGTYGSVNAIQVFFDGAPQLDCSLNGSVLGFNPIVPAGVQVIRVIGTISFSIGTPGQGTVGPNQLAYPVSGLTTARPTPFFIGQPYFDTTLGMPIWAAQLSPSVKWVNASGFPV